MEANFGSDGKGVLLEWLEECCRRFCDTEKYQNDFRYLSLWLDYVCHNRKRQLSWFSLCAYL